MKNNIWDGINSFSRLALIGSAQILVSSAIVNILMIPRITELGSMFWSIPLIIVLMFVCYAMAWTFEVWYKASNKA